MLVVTMALARLLISGSGVRVSGGPPNPYLFPITCTLRLPSCLAPFPVCVRVASVFSQLTNFFNFLYHGQLVFLGLLGEVCLQSFCRVGQIRFAHDVITVENAASLVTAPAHCDAFRHFPRTRFLHCRAAQIMNDHHPSAWSSINSIECTYRALS